MLQSSTRVSESALKRILRALEAISAAVIVVVAHSIHSKAPPSSEAPPCGAFLFLSIHAEYGL